MFRLAAIAFALSLEGCAAAPGQSAEAGQSVVVDLNAPGEGAGSKSLTASERAEVAKRQDEESESDAKMAAARDEIAKREWRAFQAELAEATSPKGGSGEWRPGFGAGGLGLRSLGKGGRRDKNVPGIGSIRGPRNGGRMTGVAGPQAGHASASSSSVAARDRQKAGMRVRLGALRVYGDISRERIERAMRRRIGLFEHCYVRGLRKDPTIEGTLGLRFTINQLGVVVLPQVWKGLHDTVDTCALKMLKGAALPKPPGGGIVLVRFEIAFASKAASEAASKAAASPHAAKPPKK